MLLACLLHPAVVRAADETSDDETSDALVQRDEDATFGASVQRDEDATFGASVQRAANATFDVLILRPTGLVMLVVGVGLFVPAAIVSSPGGTTPVRQAWDFFVVQPASFAFQRPVGEF